MMTMFLKRMSRLMMMSSLLSKNICGGGADTRRRSWLMSFTTPIRSLLMVQQQLLILSVIILAIIGSHPSDCGLVSEFQPEFAVPIENVTVPLGRDATFTCVVRSLGGYRVGWVRADSKAIQAIHTHVITHNSRVSVSHSDHSTWHLHIKNVKEDDRGSFMCQVNTDPMIFQISYLEVVIPPDFIPEETSGDLMAPEGSTVKLNCNARGHPTPNIIWKRENGQNITLKTQLGIKSQVAVYEGNVLRLIKVSRADMGVYLCIASNGVPPSISKRVMVSVHFHPVIHVPNQLVSAPLNTDVTLECNVEAYPRSIQFWIKDNGAMIISNDRYEVQEITNKSMFEVKMVLIIKKFQRRDAGEFHCIAKNSLGDVDSIIRLRELKVSGGTGNGNEDDTAAGAAANNRATFAYNESDEDLIDSDTDDDDTDYDDFIDEGGILIGKLPPAQGPAAPGNNYPYQRRHQAEINNGHYSSGGGGGGSSRSNSISSNTINTSSTSNNKERNGSNKYQYNNNNNANPNKAKNQRPPSGPAPGGSPGSTNSNNYQQSVVVPVNAGRGIPGSTGNVRVVGNSAPGTTTSAEQNIFYYYSIPVILKLIILWL